MKIPSDFDDFLPKGDNKHMLLDLIEQSLIEGREKLGPQKIFFSNVEHCRFMIRFIDHQMIFCTRKNRNYKVGEHKQISFRSFKNYSVDKYEKALGKVTFPNYEKLHNINKAYNDFFRKMIDVVNKIKTARIKNKMV